MQPERKEIIARARRKYAKMRKTNPLLDELQRVFDLRIDVEGETEEMAEEQPVEGAHLAAPGRDKKGID